MDAGEINLGAIYTWGGAAAEGLRHRKRVSPKGAVRPHCPPSVSVLRASLVVTPVTDRVVVAHYRQRPGSQSWVFPGVIHR